MMKKNYKHELTDVSDLGETKIFAEVISENMKASFAFSQALAMETYSFSSGSVSPKFCSSSHFKREDSDLHNIMQINNTEKYETGAKMHVKNMELMFHIFLNPLPTSKK